MTEHKVEGESAVSVVARNEPCPCKSGKKYKRCCGVNAAPKLFQATDRQDANPGFDSSAFEGIDQEQVLQFSRALKRLPKGQMQRLQSLMQKAMSGQDVSKEAADMEKSFPLDFQKMMQDFVPPGEGEEAENATPVASQTDFSEETASSDKKEMNESAKTRQFWKFWNKKKK